MRRPLVALFLLAAICLAAYANGQNFNPYSAVAKIQDDEWSGSAILIAVSGDKALLLSARHVMDHVGNQVTVHWLAAGGQTGRGVAVRVAPGNSFADDLALLISDRPRGVLPVSVVPFDPRQGPWVGVGWQRDEMRVAVSTAAQKAGGGLILTPTLSVGGMSGGALFNRRGQVVGVVVGKIGVRYGPHVQWTHSAAADGPTLHSMINEFRRTQHLETYKSDPYQGRRWRPYAPAIPY